MRIKQINTRTLSKYGWMIWGVSLLVFILVGLPFPFSKLFIQNVSADGVPSFTASEDAFVKSNTPNTNFGSAPDLEVQNDTRVMRSLIRFTVGGLPAGAIITNVVLQIYVPSNGSKTGGDIWQVNGPWNESTVTWANAPAIGAKLGSMPNPVKSGAWAQASIPASFVTGNGTYDFYLTTNNTTDAVYYASNNSPTAPILFVTWVFSPATPTLTASAAPPTDTPTGTATPTPTLTPAAPTDTPTGTATPTPTLTSVVPTDTPTATSTSTITLTPAAQTDTPTSTATSTATFTPAAQTSTPTETAMPTLTTTPGAPTSSPTVTETPTVTQTAGGPTSSPTVTSTPTVTNTIPVATNSPTATATPTVTSTPVPPTSSPTATATPTATSTPVPPTATRTRTPIPTQISSGDPVVVAAGDIACDPSSSSFRGGLGSTNSCHMLATANLISAIQPAAVLTLGDTQYYCGSLAAFNQSYNLSWGQFKSITHPAVGNHEYLVSGGTGCDSTNAGAAGYFTYFGIAAGLPSQGFYSYDLGSWHIVVLNSNCSQAGGCNSSSPQYQWLNQDLTAHQNQCTLAYWHIPLYSSGGRANANTKTLYQLLYNKNADLIITGHDHTYERFAPQDANGVLDTVRGIPEFVVGSGGANHTSLASLAPNSQIFNQDTYGVLKVTLHSNSYDWQFVPEAGKTFTDTGTAFCH